MKPTLPPNPAACLPVWARSFFDDWRAADGRAFVTSIDDEMEHRRDAFYRLFATDSFDMHRVWKYADRHVELEFRADFLHDLVIAADEIMPPDRLPCYGTEAPPPPRLRTREQRYARKLAELLQLLAAVTPARCFAKQSRVVQGIGSVVESIVICFDIGQVPRDYDARWRLTELGIEFTSDSKRGWLQHRRASDLVRGKAVRAASALAALPGALKHADWLRQLAVELEALPAMKVEHAGQSELVSQKDSYPDWLRWAYRQTLNYSTTPGKSPLRLDDWVTLCRVVALAPADTGPDHIAHALEDLPHWRRWDDHRSRPL